MTTVLPKCFKEEKDDTSNRNCHSTIANTKKSQRGLSSKRYSSRMNSLYGILFLWFCQCFRMLSAYTTLPTENRNRNAWTTLAAAASGDGVWGILEDAEVVDPVSKRQTTALDGVMRTRNIFETLTAMVTSNESDEFVLVVVMPQLGDFDSAEYAELLASVAEDLRRAKITLRVIGIGDSNSAKRFADFSGLDLNFIRTDPTGQ